MRIEVTREMPVAATRVWEALADLEGQSRWMRDIRSIVLIGEQRRGRGTQLVVETVIGPFRTRDVIEVIDWREGESIGVEHRGLIKGRGTLSVSATSAGSRVSWAEELRFPWWLGGLVTAWLARPVLKAIWAGSLGRLETILTSP